jgi:hypothetical protein
MRDFTKLSDDLKIAQSSLCSHKLYESLSDSKALAPFMEHHVFAVWDFMSLLKALQRGLTCVELPWRPVNNVPKELTRFINEIVLGEESDLDPEGHPCDHFSLYLKAMEEVGAETQRVERFIMSGDFSIVPPGAREFVEFNIQLAESGELHKIAAAFFYGREKLIPEMFDEILNGLEARQDDFPALVYYLKRHIELDGDEHSQLAQKCLELLCGDDLKLWNEAYMTGIQSLELREYLWDKALESYVTTQEFDRVIV